MNMFTNTSGEKGKGAANPEDIPKEDLLNLCMKLNKRMKSLEAKGQEMSKKYNTLLAERNNLMELISVTTGIPIDEGPDSDIDHIKDILLHNLNSHKIRNKTLSDKIDVLEERLEAQDGGVAPGRGIQEVCGSQWEEKNQKLKNTVYALEAAIQEKDTKIAFLEKKIILVTDACPSTQPKDEVVRGLKAMVEEKQKALAICSSSLEKLRQGTIDAERTNSASALLKAEQEGLLSSLRKDLAAALKAKEDSNKKLVQLEEYRIRTEGKLGNLVENKDKLSQSEADLDEANALIKRLQSRLHTAETSLAMRAAVVASTEGKLLSAQSDLEKKCSELVEVTEAVRVLDGQMSSLKAAASRTDELHAREIGARQEEILALSQRQEDATAAREADFVSEMDEVKRDYAKKSQVFQVLLEEKEQQLLAAIREAASLREEVELGHPADRKIFELATKQATREANLHTTRDAREVAFQQLQSSLATKDLDLANLQDKHRLILSEVAELRCVKNRETVNMDYLKNVVLQYMSFPASSPERAGLVPVISLLLQFSQQEAIQASNGAAQDRSLWGAGRPVKTLAPPPPPSEEGGRSANMNLVAIVSSDYSVDETNSQDVSS